MIGQQERRFIILCRGYKTPAKKALVNNVMTIFAVNMYKLCMDKESLTNATPLQVANAKYKPSSLATYFKHIFAYFTQKQVNYGSHEFCGMEGSFHAALKMDFEETLKLRPDYGERKCAPVDLQAAEKVRNSGLDPYKRSMTDERESGFTVCLQIMAHSMGEIFMLRGGKEVNHQNHLIVIILFFLTIFYLSLLG